MIPLNWIKSRYSGCRCKFSHRRKEVNLWKSLKPLNLILSLKKKWKLVHACARRLADLAVVLSTKTLIYRREKLSLAYINYKSSNMSTKKYVVDKINAITFSNYPGYTLERMQFTLFFCQHFANMSGSPFDAVVQIPRTLFQQLPIQHVQRFHPGQWNAYISRI